MRWYLRAWQQCLQYRGRSRRMAYWMFVLVNFLVMVAVALLDLMLGTVDEQTGAGTLSSFYALIALLPALALTVRRLHDIGRSGGWALLILIPFLGLLVLVVFMALPGDRGANDYGDDPRGAVVF